jgi:hypothetical protein
LCLQGLETEPLPRCLAQRCCVLTGGADRDCYRLGATLR